MVLVGKEAVLVSKFNFARPSESLKSVFISPILINVSNKVINVLFKDKILRRERFIYSENMTPSQ